MPAKSATIPLVLAAQAARITYHRMLSLVLRGMVVGERSSTGRWTVDMESLRQWMSRAKTSTGRNPK